MRTSAGQKSSGAFITSTIKKPADKLVQNVKLVILPTEENNSAQSAISSHLLKITIMFYFYSVDIFHVLKEN